MKTLQVFVFALVMIILTYAGSTVASDKKKSEVAAKVNSIEILKKDVEVIAKPIIEQAKAMGQQITPEIEKEIREKSIEHLITRTLLLDEAITNKVVASNEAIEKNMSKPQYRNTSLSPDELKELVKGDTMINSVIESNIMSKISVTDKELKDF
ncbi:MAG: SurA N-terminal domain-containing protein, partial [Candidatus Anammoxibacter sp.]